MCFSDGQRATLESASNVYTLGGPFVVEIEGQRYLQAGAELPKALYQLIEALGLPLGEPAAMSGAPVPVMAGLFPEG